jgi:signal transduction histidine kinase
VPTLRPRTRWASCATWCGASIHRRWTAAWWTLWPRWPAATQIPTELRANVAERPSPGVETIAYFCVAELLNNARLHAQASRAVVDVTQHPGALVLRVWDDGIGGARVIVAADDARSGTGLSGLIERISTVDGRVSIESPPGGPTAVIVTLPS